MSAATQHDDALRLLRTEHAVARVLAEACDERDAYPRLLEAIGESLGWEVGALWAAASAEEDGTLVCVETWPGPVALTDHALAPGEGLPGRVWATGEPAWIADVTLDPDAPRAASAASSSLRSAFAFPVGGTSGVLAAIEFLAGDRREPDDALLATMTSLGGRIGQSVERWRAEERLRESEARKSAILDAAFDCIITMDAEGVIVEVNPATEATFGYAARDMVGQELAELIIPPELREAHRRGVARWKQTGEGHMLGHPMELPGMRADGSTFPVELAVTQPKIEGPPQFTGYLRDVTQRRRDEEALRSLAEEQAALRRVATVVASEADRERLFAVVTEEVGRRLGANSSNTLRYEPDGTAVVAGAWSTAGVRAVPVGTVQALDGPTVGARIRDSGRPERVDDFEDMPGATAELLRGLGFRSAVGAPITLGGRLWGAVIVSTVEETPFPAAAEQRIADFAELVALALANAEAREELAASRARIVEAGDAERRRIERNLHDGAQQRLVSLSLLLRLTEKKVAKGDPDAQDLLARANAELSDALQELRELARGIHPAVLTEHGLVPALEMLAGRSACPVELSADLGDRLPQPVEAAAYYMVAEALTNAAKHASASLVRVQVGLEGGRALVEVADDGVGGAEGANGSGLRGLRDRIEALGGRLELESASGCGTTLRARIPCSGAI